MKQMQSQMSDDDPNFGGVHKPLPTYGGVGTSQAFLPGAAGSPSMALSFGQALDALKSGYRVARRGWNGKGMWLSLSGPLNGRKISADKFWSTNNATYAARQPGGEANVLPCITMKTADGSILMGWLASQTDMLSTDWEIVG